MKIYYASIAGFLKHSSRCQIIRRAIIEANTEAEAMRKFIAHEGIYWVNRMLDENPDIHIHVREIENDACSLSC